MKYLSTRGTEEHLSDQDALLQVFSKEGGLLVPAFLPKLRKEFFEDLQKLSFAARLVKMTTLFLPCLPPQALLHSLEKRFLSAHHAKTLPQLHRLGMYTEGKYVYETWRGEQGSIKEWVQEYAMTCLEVFAKEHLSKEKALYVFHAEGNYSSPAFLSASEGRSALRPLAFAPQHSLNRIQKHLIQHNGTGSKDLVYLQANYEQTQDVLRQVLLSEKIKERLQEKHFELTTTASYSFLHILAYLCFMASMYADFMQNEAEQLLKKQSQEEEDFEAPKLSLSDLPAFNLVLSDGDLAEVCAAFYLSQMGVPLKKILVSSNKNKTFSDFLRTGILEIKKKGMATYAPAGDVVYAMNLERLLFEAYRRESTALKNFFVQLQEQGVAQLGSEELKRLQRVFVGGFADNSSLQLTLREVYDRFDYCVDPHLALGMNVYSRYAKRAKDEQAVIYLMSYSPYLIPKIVVEALLEKSVFDKLQEESQWIEALSFETDLPIHSSLAMFLQTYEKKKAIRADLETQSKDDLKSDFEAYRDYERQGLVDEALYQADVQRLGRGQQGEKQSFTNMNIPLFNKEEFKAYLLEKLQ